MLQNIVVAIIIFLFSAISAHVFGQTPEASLKPSIIAGDVVTVGDKKFVINAKGSPVDIVVTDKTQFKKVSAETLDLKAAVAGGFGDVGVGDKLTVSGFPTPDGKTMPARTIYFVTKADITAKNQKEAEEWRLRGVSGKVVAVNPVNNQITVSVTSLATTSNVVLTPKEKVKFLRYAPDSIRYDQALDSNITEVRVGDMLRAAGERGQDGTTFAAEKIITGAFQTIAGTVKSVDPANGEIHIKNLQTGKDMVILINETPTMKKFPAEMAERLAGAQMGGGARPVGQPGGQGRPPMQQPGQGQGQPQGGGRAGFGGGMRRGVDDMIEGFPTITAADLKPGDMIAISSTKNGNVDRIKAIKLVAGVEPFLRMAQTQGGRRGQGVDGGFSIPGLDSIGFP